MRPLDVATEGLLIRSGRGPALLGIIAQYIDSRVQYLVSAAKVAVGSGLFRTGPSKRTSTLSSYPDSVVVGSNVMRVADGERASVLVGRDSNTTVDVGRNSDQAHVGGQSTTSVDGSPTITVTV